MSDTRVTKDTKNPTRRSIVWLVCLTVVTAAVATTWITIGRPKAAASADPLAGFKSVAITSGTLSTSESVNGTVELNQVTQVLHRIEGQTSVATTGASTGASTGTPAASTNAARSTSGAATATTAAAAANAPSNGFAPPSGVPTECGAVGPTTSSTSTTSTTTASTTSSTSSTSSTSTTSTLPGPPASAATTTTVCATTTTAASSGGTRTTGPVSGAGSGATSGARTGSGASGGNGGGSTARVTQVVTSIIAVGTPVTLGTVLYAVESKPVVALSGALPAWRTLKVGVADGPDVRQLELSLVALGYDRSATMKVDDHFDSNTRAAVERWQAGYGLAVTGSVTLGSVVFLPSPSTVSAVQTKVGASLGEGDKVLALAAANQDVVINVPTGDESFVVPGFAVTIGNVDGTVSLLRSATQNGATVVEAVVTPSAPLAGAANGATVKVTIQHDGLSGVLLAPAAALASRLDGSYAVQVVDATGNVTWVPVEVLATANGNVAIRGAGIADGTKVLQPR